MRATSQHGRPSLVQNDVLIGVRKLLSYKRVDEGYEHTPTAHVSNANGVKDTPTTLAIAPTGVVLAMVLGDNCVAGVATDGKHMGSFDAHTRSPPFRPL